MYSPAKTIGTPFIELQSVDSTNNYAMAMVHAGMAQHGTTVFTHHQVKGKGQRGKQWLSGPNQNVAMSVILHTQGFSGGIFILNMAVALATLNFFKNYVKEDVKIKWPNDIYWRDRKAGGILIENVFAGTVWKNAVVGIGANCNQVVFDNLAQRAVSIKQITGATYNILTLAQQMLTELSLILPLINDAPKTITNQYHQQLYKLNEKVKIKKGNRVFETTIKGVNDQGQLITHHAFEETFNMGEIEWIL